MTFRPQLAIDGDLAKIKFPCIVMPKIDGVRGMNLDGELTGRSLDPFPGFRITEYFSRPAFRSIDGELTLGSNPTFKGDGESLCSRTTGALGKFKGVTEMADIHMWAFDFVNEQSVALPYRERLLLLDLHVALSDEPRLHTVEWEVVHAVGRLKELIAQHLDRGYEGTIVRNPDSTVKEGRSSKVTQDYVRFKPWDDFEILVTELVEGEVNTNEAKRNTLGYTERSSAKAGMLKNGMVGAIIGTVVKDVHCKITGKLLFPAGMVVRAGSGRMTDKHALEFFQQPHTIIGHYAKIKHLAYGVIDNPRMPTFESLRLREDL